MSLICDVHSNFTFDCAMNFWFVFKLLVHFRILIYFRTMFSIKIEIDFKVNHFMITLTIIVHLFRAKSTERHKSVHSFSSMLTSRCFFISKTHTKPRQKCHRRKYFVQTPQNKRGKSVKKKNSNNKIKKNEKG